LSGQVLFNPIDIVSQTPYIKSQTKNSKIMIITCSCGAKYQLTSFKIGQKDKDKLECDVCGAIIHSWNEGKIWNKKRIDIKEDKPKM
jgi:hypothetical protein